MTQQDRPARPPSKTAIAKAEAAARRAAREAKKISDASRLAAARAQVSEMIKSMPTEYREWGVVRTRAYMQLLEITLAKVGNVTLKPATLEKLLQELQDANNWTLDYCQHLTMLHARAADISQPAAQSSERPPHDKQP